MRLDGDMTVQEAGIEEGDQVLAILLQVGGKPVIYLMPPAGSDIEASVKLSLIPEWEFSAVYPAVATKRTPTGGKSVEWNVHASSDGTLLERNTGLEVSYLFWEAECVFSHCLSLPITNAAAWSKEH